MIVKVISRTEDELAEYDYQDKLEIYVDGVGKFSAHDGEPEDANLSRDFSECHNIPELMRLAYEAGKNGEEFIIE